MGVDSGNRGECSTPSLSVTDSQGQTSFARLFSFVRCSINYTIATFSVTVPTAQWQRSAKLLESSHHVLC